MNVVVIKRHSTDGSAAPIFMAVASDMDSAKRWIQDEVTDGGPHGTGHTYMQGKSPDWWINYGVFSLTSMEVQK